MNEETKRVLRQEILITERQMVEAFQGLKNETSAGQGHVCLYYLTEKADSLAYLAERLANFTKAAIAEVE